MSAPVLPAESSPAVELRGLRKSFGGKPALKGLSLSIPRGQLYVMLGPNGAGKSTTLKIVTGLLAPDGGSVRVLGKPVVEWLRSGRVPFSFIPEEPFLYDRLSAEEFIRFVAVLGGVGEKDLAERLPRLSSLLGLDEFLDASALTYSHGMRQRAAIAAALVTAPDLLVIDEPMVGLDPRSARVLKDLLRDFVSGGGSVLLSTHTLSVAEEIADRIGVIHRGGLVGEGTAAEIKGDAPSLEAAFLALIARVEEDARD